MNPLPDRIILIGGVKRTGTSLMRNLIGSHSEIAIPPVEFGFFTDYRVRDFDTPDGYARAVDKFVAGSRPRRWLLRDDTIARSGRTACDFYCAMLNSYRLSNKPEAGYFGDKSTFIESEFETYREWFGLERIRFIHMVRNPFDCYASTKSIPHLVHWPRYAVYDFCDKWARSMILGLSLAQRYPNSYRLVRYEDLVANPAAIVADLCRWMGMPDETDRMLAAADYDRKSNSSFGDVPAKGDGAESSVVNLPAGSRLKHLSTEEVDAIRTMALGRLLPLLDYDIVDTAKSQSRAAQFEEATRHHLNLIGVKAGVPAYLHMIATGGQALAAMVLDRLRGR